MRLKIAGGCGEHGRNCFYVETENISFLIDCGVMADEEGGGYPHLTPREIQNCSYVFLTHSHADHTAALPWMEEQGFRGQIIATEHTLRQLQFSVKRMLSLESFCFEKQGKLESLEITYGYSGHCLGSVWYEFRIENKTFLFSGDYIEDTFVHRLDSIRDRCADVAVLDCAYGQDENSFETYCDTLIREIEQYKKVHPIILMPVPKYGRGLELYYLLKKHFPEFRFMADAHFVEQCQLTQQEKAWFKESLDGGNLEVFQENGKADVVFVSDPQLRRADSQKIAKQVLVNGYAIMTGTVEHGGMSDQLIREGKMSMVRFPVHLNYKQYNELIQENQFKQTIPYHSPQVKPQKMEYIL